jgi:hypothetical protein
MNHIHIDRLRRTRSNDSSSHEWLVPRFGDAFRFCICVHLRPSAFICGPLCPTKRFAAPPRLVSISHLISPARLPIFLSGMKTDRHMTDVNTKAR